MFGSKNKKANLKPMPEEEFEEEEGDEEQEEDDEEYKPQQRPVRKIPQYIPPKAPQQNQKEERQISIQDILWSQEQRIQALESWAFRVKNF